jgi:hypothetical protein
MNLQIRINEVSRHIESLKATAKKHLENNNKRRYKLVGEVIESHESELKQLNEDLIKQHRVTLYRLNNGHID